MSKEEKTKPVEKPAAKQHKVSPLAGKKPTDKIRVVTANAAGFREILVQDYRSDEHILWDPDVKTTKDHSECVLESLKEKGK